MQCARRSRGTRPPGGAGGAALSPHHDVQPGDRRRRVSPPLTDRAWWAALRRGTADDEAGIATLASAFWAHGGRPPVGVTVFVEGEEESGSPSLGRLLAAHVTRGSRRDRHRRLGRNRHPGTDGVATQVADCVVRSPPTTGCTPGCGAASFPTR